MKSIKANITLTFDDMSEYEKEFHVALINEIVRKGTRHLHPFHVKVEEVKKNDVSYDMSVE